MKIGQDVLTDLEPREKMVKKKNPFKKVAAGKKMRREYVKGWKKHDKDEVPKP